MARALGGLGQLPAARALARTAIANFKKEPMADDEELEAAEAWLAKHK